MLTDVVCRVHVSLLAYSQGDKSSDETKDTARPEIVQGGGVGHYCKWDHLCTSLVPSKLHANCSGKHRFQAGLGFSVSPSQ